MGGAPWPGLAVVQQGPAGSSPVPTVACVAHKIDPKRRARVASWPYPPPGLARVVSAAPPHPHPLPLPLALPPAAAQDPTARMLLVRTIAQEASHL